MEFIQDMQSRLNIWKSINVICHNKQTNEGYWMITSIDKKCIRRNPKPILDENFSELEIEYSFNPIRNVYF